MTKVIDAEVTVTEALQAKDLIRVLQPPKVEFKGLRLYNAQLRARLDDMGLETIEANEENLKEIKSLRTEVRKELATLENSRKLTEKTIMGPFNEFKKEYDELIKKPLTDADKDLKKKVDDVEDKLRKEKTKQFEKYFNEKQEELKIDFVKFADVGLNVQLSSTTKSLTDDVDNFFAKITNDLAVIETNANKERVLVRYMQDLDLSNAIVTVDNEVKAEEEIKAKQELKLQKQKEYLAQVEQLSKDLEEIDLSYKPKDKPKEIIEVVEEELLTITFTVTGTKDELIAVREFMKERNINYE